MIFIIITGWRRWVINLDCCGKSGTFQLSFANLVPLISVCLSLRSPTDVPHPTDGGLSVVALNETGKVRVTWSSPTLGPGQVITGYSVQYRRRGAIFYTTRFVPGSSKTSYTITNLYRGRVYEVRVASVGPLGQSGYCCRNGKQVTTYNSECKQCLGEKGILWLDVWSSATLWSELHFTIHAQPQ